MTSEEEIIRLRMRVTELEKEKEKDKRKLSILSEKNATLKEDVKVLSCAVRSGEEKLRLSLFIRFGRSSEKYRIIFNVSEELLRKAEEGSLSEEEKNTLAKAKDALEQTGGKDAKPGEKGTRNRNPESRVRGNGCGRQTFDPSYPRERQEFMLADKCPKCGTGLVDIDSPDVHEHIDILRNSLNIIQQAKHKGYCPCCGETHDENGTRKRDIQTASAPQRFIPGGLAGDSLIAASLVDKFFYGLSVTRIAKRFCNLGVDLSEQNFANWHMRAGSELKPVAEAIKGFILSQDAINGDESRLQVLDEKGRADNLDSWLWVICSATPGKPAAYFQYDPSRSSDVFKGIVGDYAGYLQADCYVGYQTKKQDYQYTLALCNAHLRRKFIDAQKAGAYPEDSPGHITLDRIITTIGKIYSIDKTHRTRWLDDKKISEQEFIRIRKEESLPQYEKLSKWVRGRYDLHRQDEFIMEGMGYYLNSEILFRSYLDCANLNPDNNRSERIIRAFSTVRMNSLFAGCPEGAHTLATMETIIQTANLWDLDLYGYVTYLLREVTKLRSLKANSVDYSQFLPWNLTPKLREEMDVHSISIKKKKSV
ncbi:MAG: IS66 family transposase [Sphaerochaeta sp.]|nr:IS66 family transposase [Sphaerochaeta sp.]